MFPAHQTTLLTLESPCGPGHAPWNPSGGWEAANREAESGGVDL